MTTADRELPGIGTRETVGVMHEVSKETIPTNETKSPGPMAIFLVVVMAQPPNRDLIAICVSSYPACKKCISDFYVCQTWLYLFIH